MNRRRDERREVGLEELAALLGDAERLAEEALSRGRAETDHDPGSNVGDLCLQPRPARAHLVLVRLVVQAALARNMTGPLPLEVLDHVRDVNGLAIDARVD